MPDDNAHADGPRALLPNTAHPRHGGPTAAAVLRELLSRAFPRPPSPPRAIEIERALLTSATGV